MNRLARRLGLGDAVVIGLGSMLGAGVFVVFGPAAAAAGGLGLLVALSSPVRWRPATRCPRRGWPRATGVGRHLRVRAGTARPVPRLPGRLGVRDRQDGELRGDGADHRRRTRGSGATPGRSRVAAVVALTAVNCVGHRQDGRGDARGGRGDAGRAGARSWPAMLTGDTPTPTDWPGFDGGAARGAAGGRAAVLRVRRVRADRDAGRGGARPGAGRSRGRSRWRSASCWSSTRRVGVGVLLALGPDGAGASRPRRSREAVAAGAGGRSVRGGRGGGGRSASCSRCWPGWAARRLAMAADGDLPRRAGRRAPAVRACRTGPSWPSAALVIARRAGRRPPWRDRLQLVLRARLLRGGERARAGPSPGARWRARLAVARAWPAAWCWR